MTSTKDVRSQFLGYFEGKDHKVLPSSPLIPHNDPTLMFANAGMNQFKNIFTANEPAPYPRAATSQKVVRAGGKHNDLDNVGYTARHLTFFEMLGNFSFGDYFKEKAITYAWEMVTKDFGLPKEKLLATVYHTDDDAFNLWKKISGLPDEKIIRIPTADNFWSMGDTGPCGPCSEIFFDHGDKIPGGPPGSPDEDGDRFVEIWNLVFMQYDQVNKETRVDLPKPCIDTGLGLERFTTVLQGVHTVFDIDLFRHLIAAAEDVIKTKYEGKNIASYRVIADHLRASCFLIADGVLPSNEGRGYVLRRIMRRAMRHAHMLGAKQPVMWKLVPALINEMGEAYPEIKRAEALSVETLRSEETRFKETLERGLKLLEEETEKLSSLLAGERASKERSDAARRVGADAFPPTKTADAVPTPPQGGSGIAFPGEVAFKLYDTFGFPLDLTQDILRGKDIAVDIEGFERSMQEQRERARAAWKGSGDSAVGTLWFDLKEKAGGTEFLGYVNEKSAGNVTAIVKDGAEVSSADKGDKVQVLFNQTPFYGESGGQVGDSGSIMQGKKMVGEVTDTKKMLDNLHIHTVTLHAPLKIGDTVDLVVNQERRARIRANHSATHLLHAALRRHLGEHVTQKGSLVAEDRLRFDISHPKAITAEELKIIEDEVNMMVWQNSEAETKLMKSDEAIHAGAMALFGEKYGDEVRVLTMGVLDERMSGLAAERKSSGTADPLPYSVELCGGIHVKRTGDIGLFKIISEGAIASGVRRIEAVTRDGAFSYLNNEEAMLKGIAADLKTSLEDLPKRISALQEDKKKLERELGDARKKMALGGGGVEAKPEQIGDVQFIGKHFEDLPPKELRGVADSLMKPIKDNGVVMVTSGFEGKASIVIAVSPALTGKHNAAELVKIAAEAVGGKGGGGKPDMAQSGGPDGSKSEEAIEKIKAALR